MTAVPLLLMLLSQGTPPTDAQAAAPTLVEEDIDDPAYRIGKLVRCPVCQGMSVAESPAPMARSMMARVRELVAEGKSEEEILAYFEQSYGEWARLQPKTSGSTLLVWVLPPLALLLGLALVVLYGRKGKAPAAAAAKPQQDAQAPRDAPPSSRDADAYLQAVRDEVDR